MKLIRGKLSGAGGIHKPSGHWMAVFFPRLTMMPEGHIDSEPAKVMFSSVSSPSLKTSQVPCRPTCARLIRRATLANFYSSRAVRRSGKVLIERSALLMPGRYSRERWCLLGSPRLPCSRRRHHPVNSVNDIGAHLTLTSSPISHARRTRPQSSVLGLDRLRPSLSGEFKTEQSAHFPQRCSHEC